MARPDIRESVSDIKNDLKEYASLRIDGLKLSLVENISVFTGRLLSIVLVLAFVVIALVFISNGLLDILEAAVSPLGASLIVGGFFILLAAIVFLLRKRLFLNTFITILSKTFFRQQPQESQLNSQDKDETKKHEQRAQ